MPPAKPRKKTTAKTKTPPTAKKASKTHRTAPRATKPSNKGSRPTKLTADIQEQICAGIRKGVSNTAAAAHIGINKATFYRWLKAGHTKGGKKLYRDFADAIDQAYEEFEAKAVEVIAKYALEGWDADTTTVKTIKDKKTGKTLELLEVTKRTEKMIPDIASIKWLLERRRQGFTPLQRIEHSQQDDKPLEIVFIPPPSKKDKDGTVDAGSSSNTGK